MTNLRLSLALCLSAISVLAQDAGQTGAAAARKPGDYAHGPDSLPQAGVPKGRLEGPFEWNSKIIAGTVRRYWIFVPAQYTTVAP